MPGQKRRRRALLLTVSAVALACAGWVVWQVIAFATTDDPFRTEQSASCADAMRFADQKGLPAGAYDATCSVRVWLDTQYDAEFRIGRLALRTWLASAYPDAEWDPDCYPKSVDACTHVELNPAAKGGAMAIDIDIVYEKDGRALVRFSPFDV
ncbi:hypothetical protein [Streptomyces longispororuber]|uniref:hypothetical protein n=1 Tax=Streptomyces longispororuber TaxID=68230 RepID=UPI002109E494|nr:hypothetical protein [Streptomyces longispororuber]MCQ4213533.1 hypothetical protein [Streptomyces longispororuber]